MEVNAADAEHAEYDDANDRIEWSEADDLWIASRFVLGNNDLRTVFSGFAIQIEHDTDGLHVHLQIDHNTSRDELDMNWGTVKAWTDRVQTWNAERFGSHDRHRLPTVRTLQREHRQWYLALLEDLHGKGKSYADLARIVNERHAQDIGQYVAGIQHNTKSPWLLVLDLNNAVALELLALGFSDADLNNIINDAIERVRNGESAFDYGCEPVTADLIREKLRAWRKAH